MTILMIVLLTGVLSSSGVMGAIWSGSCGDQKCTSKLGTWKPWSNRDRPSGSCDCNGYHPTVLAWGAADYNKYMCGDACTTVIEYEMINDGYCKWPHPDCARKENQVLKCDLNSGALTCLNRDQKKITVNGKKYQCRCCDYRMRPRCLSV